MVRVGLRGGVFLLCVAASLSLLSATQAGSAEPVRSLVEQALSARGAGKSLQEREILERGLEVVGPEDPASYRLYQMLGQHHADLGNLARAAELSEQALHSRSMPHSPGWFRCARAARCANDTPYGLAASIWSNALSRVNRLIPKIRAGTVWVNCQNILDSAMPFGGYKQSGIGRELGSSGARRAIYIPRASR